MQYGGKQLAAALYKAGLIDEIPHKRKRNNKKFSCRKCGTTMVNPEWTNVMYCPKCDSKDKNSCASYFIFTNGRN